MEPYCSASTRVADRDRGMGQGPNVVGDLVEKAKNFGLTGTMRKKRIHKVTILQKYDLEKKMSLEINIVLHIQMMSKDGRIPNLSMWAPMCMVLGRIMKQLQSKWLQYTIDRQTCICI